MKYEEITEKILKSAFEVHKKLGCGFLEKVYRNALALELGKNNIEVECEIPIKVLYDGKIIGAYLADIVVENKIIIELKAVNELHRIHEVQLVNYLTATHLDVGLLLNFGKKSLQYKRKVRELINN